MEEQSFSVRQRLGFVLLTFILALLVVKLRFWPYVPEVFFGDDLDNFYAYLQHDFASSVRQSLFQVYFERYRPVWALVLGTFFGTFGDRIELYMLLNAVIHALTVALFFAVAWRLSRGRWLPCLGLALAAASSRFALYQVTQVTGTVESLALVFCLLTVYCVSRIEGENREALIWGWAAIGASFLAMHSHERYIGLAVWLVLAFQTSPEVRSLPARTRTALLLGSGIPLGFNYFYKVGILNMPFLVGTSGTHISLEPAVMIGLAGHAVLSLLGFNSGPKHLVGISIFDLGSVWLWLLSITFAVSSSTLIGLAVRNARPTWRQSLRWPLLLAAAALLLLVPPVLSIRFEQRWLYAPFTFLLLTLAWASSQMQLAWRGWSVTLVMACAASVAIDAAIEPYFENIFFVYSGRFSRAAKQSIADVARGDKRDVALVAAQEHCDWSLLEGRFFAVYGGSQREVHCFPTLEAAAVAQLPPGTPVYDVTFVPPR